MCLALNGLDPAGISELTQSDAVREWLAGRLAKRLARLQRSATAAVGHRCRVDLAIARHLVSVGWPIELQVGLFDRRDERAFVAARDEAAVHRARDASASYGDGRLPANWTSVRHRSSSYFRGIPGVLAALVNRLLSGVGGTLFPGAISE